MLKSNKAEKAVVMVGICLVAAGCAFVAPGFGVGVLGVGTIIFGAVAWAVEVGN